MCVDQCVPIHTDHKRPGKKLLKTLSDTMLFTSYLGSLCVEALGKLTSLSDIEDPQLLITDQYVSCYVWNTLQPTQRTCDRLMITTKQSDDELLPLGPSTERSPASSLEHMDWPCVSTEVGEDKRCGLQS